MYKLKRAHLLVISIFGFNFFSATAMGAGPLGGPTYRIYKPGYLETSFQLERFFSDANYDENGKQALLGVGSYLRNYDYTFKGRLHLSSSSALSAGLNLRNVETDDNFSHRTKTAISDLTLGTDMKWNWGTFDFLVDLTALICAYSISRDNLDSPAFGDGANEFKTLAILQRRAGNMMGYAFGGYNYRDHGLSDYIPLGVGVQWSVNAIVFGGEIKGALLGSNDVDYTPSKSARHQFLKKVNGGSFKYYSTDPEWLTAEANFKYKLTSQFAFTGGGGTTFKGYNIADGNFWYLGIQIQWPVYQTKTPDLTDVQKKQPHFVPDEPDLPKPENENSAEEEKTSKKVIGDDEFAPRGENNPTQ